MKFKIIIKMKLKNWFSMKKNHWKSLEQVHLNVQIQFLPNYLPHSPFHWHISHSSELIYFSKGIEF